MTSTEKSGPRSGGEQPRVTIAQVAELAGVSPTTVSHVLSGKRLVGAATRSNVQEAIRQLGYRPNSVARALRTRRSRMVAVVVPDITNPFYSVLIRGLADAVDGADYGTYVCNTDGVDARETKFLEDVMDRGADGIVLASIDSASVAALKPAGMGTPVVCIGGAIDHPRVDVITADDEVGAHAAVEHLIRRGSRRIAMIAGPPDTGAPRIAGYEHALTEAGIRTDRDLVVAGDWTRKGGRTAMRQLMNRPERPDGVFCANDLAAIGAIDVAHELGLSVPGDIAVVGFDDVDAATIVNPPLTTVLNPAYDTGRKAGELLVDRMRGEYTGEGRSVVLPCPLVVRASA